MDEVLLAAESADPLVARLVAFCDRHEVEAAFARFCERHANEFRGVAADDEQSHEAYALFHEYEALFEKVVRDFLEQENLSDEQFFAHCQALLRDREKNEGAADNLDIVLSALDFGAFCELMAREARETQAALKAAEDMGF